MDGIIFLVILIPLVILILLFVITSRTSSLQDSFDSLNHKLDKLTRSLDDLTARLKHVEKDIPNPKPVEAVKSEAPPIAVEPVIPQEKQATPPPVFEKKTDPVTPRVEQKEPAPAIGEIKPPEQPVTEQVGSFWSKNFDEKTDWEKFIGENLANKIGIGILVLGISFFVKFAIDKDWINETGRVVIGLLSGGILIGLAHYTRNTYRSFSSVLVGGGLSVLYFTIAFAFHEYHLISQRTAFIIMVVITAFAVVISILYNRLELAVLATLGGFVTPFLVSTGQNNYVALFSYLVILNTGITALSWFKRWKAINIIALIFTVIIFGGWMLNQRQEKVAYQWAIAFSTLFFLQFLAMAIINNIKLRVKFGGLDFLLLVSINFLYYAAGTVIISFLADGKLDGLFTVSLGVLNFALAWMFFRLKQVDKNFVYLLIGLTLTFISLTAPVQLEGNNITLFWAAEAVVLMWLYQRSRIILLKIAAPLVLGLMFISLMIDLVEIYFQNDSILPVIANKGFITTIVCSTAVLIYYRFMRVEADNLYLPGVENRAVRNTLLIVGISLGYIGGVLEIYYQFSTRSVIGGIFSLYLQLYNYLFILMLFALFRRTLSLMQLKFYLTSVAIVLYFFFISTNYRISQNLLTTPVPKSHFIAHWLSAALLVYLIYDLIATFRKQKNWFDSYHTTFTWLTGLALIIVLSSEMHYIFMWLNYADTANWHYWENLYYKAGLSILWGLCSFAAMWLGMRYKYKVLRIFSLNCLL